MAKYPEIHKQAFQLLDAELKIFHHYLIHCQQHNPSQIPLQICFKVEYSGSQMTLPLLAMFARFFFIRIPFPDRGLGGGEVAVMKVPGMRHSQIVLGWNFSFIWSDSNSALSFPHSCLSKNVNILPFPPPYFVLLHTTSPNSRFSLKFSQLI